MVVPLEVSDATFGKEIEQHNGIALVDFWAPWCGPCRIVGPVVEELAQEYEGKVKVAKLNVDENQSTAARYQVMGIPTLIIFRDGEPVDKIVGALPKRAIESKLSRWLDQTQS